MTDFVRAFQTSAEMGQWAPLAQTIREWKIAAIIHVSDALHQQAQPVPD